MMAKEKINGSVDLLAKAMRQVFTEAVEEGVEPIRKDIAEIKENVNGLKGDIKQTNKNVQTQLAQNRKDITADVKKALKDR